MSNHKSCEIQDRRKPTVSVPITINRGLVGPKANPKGVADGQQINISALLKDSIESLRSAEILICCPSATPFGLALGPTNPRLIVIGTETVGFRRSWISQDLWLLIPAFSLPCTPLNFTIQLRCAG